MRDKTVLRVISDTSIVIAPFRYLYRGYSLLEQRVSYVYYNSQVFRLAKHFQEKIRICFRYSFLGKVSGIKQTTPMILDNSRAAEYLISFYKRTKGKITHYLRDSLISALVKDIKEQLSFSPVAMISTVVIIAIDVNVVLSFVLQRPIGLWGWLIRGLVFFIAALGLFCEADYSALKNNSVFLKKLWRE